MNFFSPLFNSCYGRRSSSSVSLRPPLSSASLIVVTSSSAVARGFPLPAALPTLFFEGFAHLLLTPKSCCPLRNSPAVNSPSVPPSPSLDLARSHQVNQPQVCAVGADLFSQLRVKQESGLTQFVFAPFFFQSVDSLRNRCCLYCLSSCSSSCFCIPAKDHRIRRRSVSSAGHCNLFTSICTSTFCFFVHVHPINAVCCGWSKTTC